MLVLPYFITHAIRFIHLALYSLIRLG